MRLVVAVDPRRDREGSVRLLDAHGNVVLGPARICASASPALAARAGNAAREVLRPGGHPPFGRYRLVRIDAVDAAHQAEQGPYCLQFEPASGDALRAESYGRLLLDLHGGRLGDDGGLRATAGGLRVEDEVLRQIAAQLAGIPDCELELQAVRESWWARLFSRRRTLSEDRAIERDSVWGSHDRQDSEPTYTGRGGEFAGGGASGSWDGGPADRTSPSTAAAVGAGVAAGVVLGAAAAVAAQDASAESTAAGDAPSAGGDDGASASDTAESASSDADSGTSMETSY